MLCLCSAGANQCPSESLKLGGREGEARWPRDIRRLRPGGVVKLKWVSRGIRDSNFFVGIIHARRDIEARVGILTGRIC